MNFFAEIHNVAHTFWPRKLYVVIHLAVETPFVLFFLRDIFLICDQEQIEYILETNRLGIRFRTFISIQNNLWGLSKQTHNVW